MFILYIGCHIRQVNEHVGGRAYLGADDIDDNPSSSAMTLNGDTRF